jgi:hypothetical protein
VRTTRGLRNDDARAFDGPFELLYGAARSANG